MDKRFESVTRSPRMAWKQVASMVLVAILAGCTNPSATQDAEAKVLVDALRWTGSYGVDVASEEPDPGFMRFAYQEGLFAIDNEKEHGLHPHIIVDESRVVTSNTGNHWTLWDKDQAIADGRLSPWVGIWDLRAVLTDEDTILRRGETPEEVDAEATLRLGSHEATVGYHAVASGERIEEVTISGQGVREGPHVVRPSDAGMRFSVQWPDAAAILDGAEATRSDEQALDGHVFVVGLVEQYCKTRAGQLPVSVDPETLRVELTTSGQSWPTSPYDGEPLEDGGGQGHFTWSRESTARGTYEGSGWDGPIRRDVFGPTRCS